MLKQASPLVYILNRHKQQEERTRDETRVPANGEVSLLATSTDGKGENEKLSSGKLKDFSSVLDCVYPSNASMIVLNYEIFLMRQRVEDDRAADGEMTENYQTKSGLASPELVDLFRNSLLLAGCKKILWKNQT